MTLATSETPRFVCTKKVNTAVRQSVVCSVPPPSVRQVQCLRAIVAFIAKHGKPPTYQQIADALGLKSKSPAHTLVMRLEASGYVKTAFDRSRRSIEVLRTA